MNRVDGSDFGWAAEQARRALEAAQAQAQRQAELERARTLAGTALPGLDPQNPEGPSLLGKVLAQVQGLMPEARSAFASDLARVPPPTVVAGPTPHDAAGVVEVSAHPQQDTGAAGELLATNGGHVAFRFVLFA